MNDFDLDHIFAFHPANLEQGEKHQRVRDAAKEFAKAVIANTPTSPDQSTAIRQIREAMQTANAAIALDGRLYVQPQNIDPNTYRKD